MSKNEKQTEDTTPTVSSADQVSPVLTPAEVKESEHKANDETVEAHKAEAKEVDTKLGSSKEEAAAKRAKVSEERLDNPAQNREPQNEFEQANQKVTEKERVAAQKVSSMSTEDKIEKASTPNASAATDAERTTETNQGSDVAAAIRDGFKASKDDSFALTEDPGVEHRFTLVKNKNDEVMIRENETGTLSKIQLLSLEEKEASIQEQEVTEL